MARSSASQPRRAAFSLMEAVVALVVIVIIVLVAIPVVLSLRERGRKISCAGNLRKLHQATDRYYSSHNTYPIGARYDTRSNSPGLSWWAQILPFAEDVNFMKNWQQVAASGDFSLPAGNPNAQLVDGYQPSFMLCPASPMQALNDPSRHWSAASRSLVSGGAPQGIVVPMYAAVAGSAPDAAGIKGPIVLDKPWGRNTKDGKYGILSASGVFPPNQSIRDAAIRDGKANTLLFVEQSDFGRDESVDPPLEFELRSSWPKGAFMGTSGNYGGLNQTAAGINGTGDEQCYNITTIRYPVNTKQAMPGILIEMRPRPAKSGEATQALALPPAVVSGDEKGTIPGHNQGIFSAHAGGAQAVMGSGQVRWLADDTDLQLLMLLSTRDDERLVPEF